MLPQLGWCGAQVSSVGWLPCCGRMPGMQAASDTLASHQMLVETLEVFCCSSELFEQFMSWNAVSRHTTAALQLNSLPGGDGGIMRQWRKRALRVHRERDVTTAGQLCGWISHVDQVGVSSLLIPSCTLDP
ncbi:hypothetical protein NQZ68_008280 [Dissostichus eleginoides]|nr:hypothetical protein NQZ68_008280 [Dissostichus eleginoides]